MPDEEVWSAAIKAVMRANSPSSDEEECILRGALRDMRARRDFTAKWSGPPPPGGPKDSLESAYASAIDLRVHSEAVRLEGHEAVEDLIGILDIAVLRYRKMLNARR